MNTKRLAMIVAFGLPGLALALLGLYAAPPGIAQAADVSATLGEITVWPVRRTASTARSRQP
jgi:hypothetical protein